MQHFVCGCLCCAAVMPLRAVRGPRRRSERRGGGHVLGHEAADRVDGARGTVRPTVEALTLLHQAPAMPHAL
eukprot:1653940-Pleurochrysis_carterae.AAC.3